jgi:hypothetical protein
MHQQLCLDTLHVRVHPSNGQTGVSEKRSSRTGRRYRQTNEEAVADASAKCKSIQRVEGRHKGKQEET